MHQTCYKCDVKCHSRLKKVIQGKSKVITHGGHQRALLRAAAAAAAEPQRRRRRPPCCRCGRRTTCAAPPPAPSPPPAAAAAAPRATAGTPARQRHRRDRGRDRRHPVGGPAPVPARGTQPVEPGARPGCWARCCHGGGRGSRPAAARRGSATVALDLSRSDLHISCWSSSDTSKIINILMRLYSEDSTPSSITESHAGKTCEARKLHGPTFKGASEAERTIGRRGTVFVVGCGGWSPIGARRAGPFHAHARRRCRRVERSAFRQVPMPASIHTPALQCALRLSMWKRGCKKKLDQMVHQHFYPL